MLDRSQIFAYHGDLQAAISSRKVAGQTKRNGRVAIVPIVGYMSRDGMVDGENTGTSTDETRLIIKALTADPTVDGILLDVDSGGGTSAGTLDLANEVAAAAKQKYVAGYIRDYCCSAAYEVASQARQLFAGPTSFVGSIGTFLVVQDTSAAAAMDGVKVHVITTGKHKGAGVPGSEITPEQLAEIQRNVDSINEHFLAGVASGRKLPLARVRELADGRVHVGQEAVKLGLIDGVLSFDSFYGQVCAAFPAQSQVRLSASQQFDAIVADELKRGVNRATAIANTVAMHPKLHREYLEEFNSKNRRSYHAV